MATWGDILLEIQHSAQQRGGNPDLDSIRRNYLIKAHQYTSRPTILYASKFTQPEPNTNPEEVSITDEDVQGFMEVVRGLQGPDLDLILHSPGGSAEAAEAIVTYLRSKFSNIRVIVPHMAMSAATMLACAANSIVMGKHSFLGPIDPQLILHSPVGPRLVPAQDVLAQFDRARQECQDPALLAAWIPMLSQYGPDLLVQCENLSEMSKVLVRGWLETNMFSSLPNAGQKAEEIAEWLCSHSIHKSHSRHIPRIDLQARGLVIENLEDDQTTQDLFLSIYHATTHTFGHTYAVKIIENHEGRAFVKQQMRLVLPGMTQGGPSGSLPPPPV